jgi:pimeloyl-ACP methyl ester carboxylesterase
MMKQSLRIALFLIAQALISLGVQSLAQQSPPRRPQTPQPPFPYDQREVTYTNSADGTRLVGTLTIPQGAGPHPAAVLVSSGSGGVDRDATAAGHKPFLVIADYLTRRGVAVLRVDSRKADEYLKFTVEDFAGDVLAGVNFLKKQPEIAASKIGLVGHSLGGMIAGLAAAKSDDMAFAVLLAAPTVPIRDFSLTQRGQRLRAGGMPEEEVRKRLSASLTLYDRLAAGEENASLQEELREFIKLQLPPEMSLTPEQLNAILKQEMATVRSRYYKFLNTYDPRVALRKVKYPVLALNGSLDQVVAPKDNLGEIEKALREAGNSDVTVIELYGLNHFFQVAKTGSPLEVSQIEETISPKVLQILTGWIRISVGLER